MTVGPGNGQNFDLASIFIYRHLSFLIDKISSNVVLVSTAGSSICILSHRLFKEYNVLARMAPSLCVLFIQHDLNKEL